MGQELLDALLEKAKAEGHTQVSLSVEKDSPAVGFYERMGMRYVRESELGPWGRTSPVMRLDLPQVTGACRSTGRGR